MPASLPQIPPQPPLFLTPSEIAARLKVSKMTIYRLVKEGELPATRVGRSIRIRRADLQKYLETQAMGEF